MNTETIVKELTDLKNIVTEMINNIIEIVTPKPEAPPAPPVQAPVTPVELIMTAAANGATYQQYKDAGWTDEQMIQQGIATAPVVAPPAPAPNVMTPEALNNILVEEFNRIGDRAPIDNMFKELGFTGASDLPADKYQALIDKVKLIPSKAV